MEIKDVLKRLEEIRIELTRLYIELGNFDYVEADMVLSQDINKIQEKIKESVKEPRTEVEE